MGIFQGNQIKHCRAALYNSQHNEAAERLAQTFFRHFKMTHCGNETEATREEQRPRFSIT